MSCKKIYSNVIISLIQEQIEEFVRQKLEIMTAKMKQESVENSIDATANQFTHLTQDGTSYYPIDQQNFNGKLIYMNE